MVEAQEDERHVPGTDDPIWQESFYFNGYDPKNDIWIVIRLGLEPNRKTCNVVVYMAVEGREVYARNRQDILLPGGTVATGIEVSGLRLSSSQLGKVFRLAFNDPAYKVSFDFEWRAIMPVYDALPSGTGANIAGHLHIEQAGRVSGKAGFQGREWDFSGVGNRDHAVGLRDWTKLMRHILAWPVFNDNTAMSFIRVYDRRSDKPLDMMWYFDGRDVRSMKFIDYMSVFNEEDRPISATFVAEDESGKRYEMRCTRRALCHWPWDGYRFTECAFEFQLSDGRVGYGLMELGWLGNFTRAELSTLS